MPLPEEVDIINDYLKKKRTEKKTDSENEEKLFALKKKPASEKKGVISVFSGIFGRKEEAPKIVIQNRETPQKQPSRKDEMLKENNAEFDNLFENQKKPEAKNSGSEIEFVKELPEGLKKELKQDRQAQDESGEVVFSDRQEAIVKPVAKSAEEKTPEMQGERKMANEEKPEERGLVENKEPEQVERKIPRRQKPEEKSDWEDIRDMLGDEKAEPEKEESMEDQKASEAEREAKEKDNVEEQEFWENKEMEKPAEIEDEKESIEPEKEEKWSESGKREEEKQPYFGPVFPEKKPEDDKKKLMLKALKDLIQGEEKHE